MSKDNNNTEAHTNRVKWFTARICITFNALSLATAAIFLPIVI